MSHVYLIQRERDQAIKIGMSINPDIRIMKIKSEEEGRLHLLFVSLAFPTSNRIEKIAHKILHDRRIDGEWFRVSLEEGVAAVYAAIETDKDQGENDPDDMRYYLRPDELEKYTSLRDEFLLLRKRRNDITVALSVIRQRCSQRRLFKERTDHERG